MHLEPSPEYITSWAINLASVKKKKKKKKRNHSSSLFWPHCSIIRSQLLGGRGATIKNSNIWSLSKTLLNNQEIIEEIKTEIKIYIETSENKNTTTPNLWDTVKSVLRARFISIQTYLKKEEKSQIT